MRKSISIVSLVFASVFIAFGQDQIRPAVSSSVPNTAKYEIVQSDGGSRGLMTLRLDKNTGRVFRFSGCPQKTFIGTGQCWKEMTILDLPKNSNDGVARYQIVIGNSLARYILLLNVTTGETWIYESEDRWTPLLDTVMLPQPFEIVK